MFTAVLGKCTNCLTKLPTIEAMERRANKLLAIDYVISSLFFTLGVIALFYPAPIPVSYLPSVSLPFFIIGGVNIVAIMLFHCLLHLSDNKNQIA